MKNTSLIAAATLVAVTVSMPDTGMAQSRRSSRPTAEQQAAAKRARVPVGVGYVDNLPPGYVAQIVRRTGGELPDVILLSREYGAPQLRAAIFALNGLRDAQGDTAKQPRTLYVRGSALPTTKGDADLDPIVTRLRNGAGAQVQGLGALKLERLYLQSSKTRNKMRGKAEPVRLPKGSGK